MVGLARSGLARSDAAMSTSGGIARSAVARSALARSALARSALARSALARSAGFARSAAFARSYTVARSGGGATVASGRGSGRSAHPAMIMSSPQVRMSPPHQLLRERIDDVALLEVGPRRRLRLRLLHGFFRRRPRHERP